MLGASSRMGQGLELSRAARFLRDEGEQRAHYDSDARRHEGPLPQERPSGGLVGRLGARLVAQQCSLIPIGAEREAGGDLGVTRTVKRSERGGVNLLKCGRSGPETPDHPKREQPANDRAATHSVEEVDVNGDLVNIGRPSLDHPMLNPGRVELGHQTVEQHWLSLPSVRSVRTFALMTTNELKQPSPDRLRLKKRRD